MKTLTNFGDFTKICSRIYIPLLQHSVQKAVKCYSVKWLVSPRWWWKFQIIFEEGYSIGTFQNHRRLPECRNNHFEEGFIKILKINKCFHRSKPNFNFYNPHNKKIINHRRMYRKYWFDFWDLQKKYSSHDTIPLNEKFPSYLTGRLDLLAPGFSRSITC